MRRQNTRALPAWLQRGIDRTEKERKAALISRPMRNVMDMLARGEVYEIDGRPVMRMPEIDTELSARADWCEVAPALEGWRDCWNRLAPDISTYYIGVLAERLRNNKPITPRLVEQARAEFDATIARIVDIPDERISSAIRTTEIAWEVEKLNMQECDA
jgi:hypothetical protein